MTSPGPIPPRRATLSAIFGLLMTVFSTLWLSACGNVVLDYKPEATGPDAQLTVVIDSAYWQDSLGIAVKQHLAPYIETLPRRTRMFDLRVRQLTSNAAYETIKKFKNVVFVAPLSDSSNVARFLRARFSEAARQTIRQGNGVLISKPNLWRRDQQVFYATAATPEALIETLQREGEAFRDTLNLVLRRRLYEDMFDRGRQPEKEEQLMEEHGFAVNMQHDYKIVQDTTLGQTGFVLLVRSLPQTWRRIFIWYKENADPSVLSPEWIYQKRDSLAQIYLQGARCGYAKLDRRSIQGRDYPQTEQVTFEGRYGYETRGLWYTVERTPEGYQLCGEGGALLNYTFYDQQSGRIYMIGGMIFAPKPEFDDRQFLRQVEVIAHTFRTQTEVQPQESQVTE